MESIFYFSMLSYFETMKAIHFLMNIYIFLNSCGALLLIALFLSCCVVCMYILFSFCEENWSTIPAMNGDKRHFTKMTICIFPLENCGKLGWNRKCTIGLLNKPVIGWLLVSSCLNMCLILYIIGLLVLIYQGEYLIRIVIIPIHIHNISFYAIFFTRRKFICHLVLLKYC